MSVDGHLRLQRDGNTLRWSITTIDGVVRKTRRDHFVEELSSLSEEQLDGLEVTFEWNNGQAREVRPRGAPRPPRRQPPPAAPPVEVVYVQPGGDSKGASPGYRFANPYTFVRTPPRQVGGPLADGPGVGHDSLRAGLISGRIGLRITTVTPLLIPDSAIAVRADKADARPVHALVDGDKLPVIPVTSLKGALRSAVEAVTNSRFSVFFEHDDRLAYRRPAGSALDLVPARVNDEGTALHLLPGTTPLGRQKEGPMHAAWLPAYGHLEGAFPIDRRRHGDKVRATLQLFQHSGKRGPDFRTWRVVEIDGHAAHRERKSDGGTMTPLKDRCVVEGWVCWTNQNIKNKHDERLFFGDPVEVPLTEDHRTRWRQVIKSYCDAHDETDIFERRVGRRRVEPWEKIGSTPGMTGWSRHLYEKGAEKLAPGTLLYVSLNAQKAILGLYPVQIARELFPESPASLLGAEHQPASRFESLSPADRVFGWVRDGADEGVGAYRGVTRIAPVRCQESSDPVEAINPPLPLAILGAPKPQQGRFYLAAGANGQPIGRGTPKAELYSKGQRLRGRKFYVHANQVLDPDYWSKPSNPELAARARPPREYFRPEPPMSADPKEREKSNFDSQNSAVHSWVRIGVTFSTTIEVTNLSAAELGALLWVCSLPDGHVLRLGAGKPLGLGCVRVELDASGTDLADGSSWQEYYGSLTSSVPSVTGTVERCIDAFVASLGGRFEEVPQIADFLTVTKGLNAPVHYPRITQRPDPKGENFRWFTNNDRERRGEVAEGHSLPLAGGLLPLLTDDSQG